MSNESLTTKLQELFDLYNSGALSKDEYDLLKSELFNGVNIPRIDKTEPAIGINPSTATNDGYSDSKEGCVIIPPVKVRSNKINIPTAQVDSQQEPSNHTLRNVIIATLIICLVFISFIALRINDKYKPS